ncbi:hypothetical protein TNCV_3745101 [Trichonephila clavipes]|nr:hypothetical protein TNCV_3745101 [Trichonephila clavipes]
MRLPLINKDDTLVAVKQCSACSTFTSINSIQQLFTWQYILKEAKEYTMNLGSQQHTFDRHSTKDYINSLFFYLCKSHTLAKTLMYSEVPRHFRWDARQNVLQIRKKGLPLADFSGYVTVNALGRVYTVHTSNIEAFHI